MAFNAHFSLLAEYNQLMNQRMFDAASGLSESALSKDTGAFFKSVLGTLNHIMVGDILWLKRFAVHPSSSHALQPIMNYKQPASLDETLFADFVLLRENRALIDQMIIDWVCGLKVRDLEGCMEYTSVSGVTFKKPLAGLIEHLFLHQTHHRGQVTTLLSQFGADFGETDIIEIIEECQARGELA